MANCDIRSSINKLSYAVNSCNERQIAEITGFKSEISSSQLRQQMGTDGNQKIAEAISDVCIVYGMVQTSSHWEV